MGKTYELNATQLAEIETASKKSRDKQVDKRLQVLILRGHGMKNIDAAEKVGVHKNVASRWMSAYVKNGLGALVDNHYTSHRHNLSFEEEAELLKPFLELAEAGKIVDTKEIKKAYIEKVGHEIGGGQIYRVLKRHKWRKVMPRSKHPKSADEEAVNASKKLKLE
jgi:transposase